MIVGVLALQGDFEEHIVSLENHKVKSKEIRTIAELKEVDALILPGGESTVIAKLMKSSGLDEAIISRVQDGMPVWGTCSGAILLANQVKSPVLLDTQLSLLDIDIERNAYGRQSDSFKTNLEVPGGSQKVYFIRAPKIHRKGKGIKVLSKYKTDPVMLRSKNVLVTTFHSELTESNRVLEYFLGMT
jgi:5'-phosphate synthase pdxT subunit